MKPKKIKRISYFLLLLPLCVVLLGAGCEKDDPDYNPNSIIGKWEWVESWYSGISSFKVYPEKNHEKILEFTADSLMIFKENSEIVNTQKVDIDHDTLIFYDNNEVRQKNTIEIKNDTLRLKNVGSFQQVSYPFISIYKRIN